jgi:hypothetical protein
MPSCKQKKQQFLSYLIRQSWGLEGKETQDIYSTKTMQGSSGKTTKVLTSHTNFFPDKQRHGSRKGREGQSRAIVVRISTIARPKLIQTQCRTILPWRRIRCLCVKRKPFNPCSIARNFWTQQVVHAACPPPIALSITSQ